MSIRGIEDLTKGELITLLVKEREASKVRCEACKTYRSKQKELKRLGPVCPKAGGIRVTLKRCEGCQGC